MDLSKIVVGMRNEAEEIVSEKNTAAAVGSGTLLVYATPCMVALMEKAAADLLEQSTPEGITTVGISLNIEHKATTPVGLGIRAVAEVKEVEGRKITLEVKAFDDKEEIGAGTHVRFAVDAAKFLAKAATKGD